MEVFKFVIERINFRNVFVKFNFGVKLGGIGFDGCMDDYRVLIILLGLYVGVYFLDNGCFIILL